VNEKTNKERRKKMNAKHLVITLLLVFAAFMTAPAFAASMDTPGVIVNPSFTNSAPATSEAPAAAPEKEVIHGYDLKAQLPVTSIYLYEKR
jgi:hypothetical protein